MMRRILPDDIYRGLPCSAVALGCALGIKEKDKVEIPEGLRKDGYLSLSGMNKFIRPRIKVRRRVDFPKGRRPILRDVVKGNDLKAIVCCKGHFVYVDKENYYSFFRNGNDDVIALWWLAEE